MNSDPQAILQRLARSSRPLVERVADPFRQIIAAPVRPKATKAVRGGQVGRGGLGSSEVRRR